MGKNTMMKILNLSYKNIDFLLVESLEDMDLIDDWVTRLLAYIQIIFVYFVYLLDH